jgi:uncharacterized membrane protein
MTAEMDAPRPTPRLAERPREDEPPPISLPDTGRLEAFSDGVFAVAITLLILNLHVPTSDDLQQKHVADVFQYLATQWPSYLAYVTSFLFILVMWMNHHWLFHLIGKADNLLMIFNGLLLLLVVAVPFSTDLLAEYLPPKTGLSAQANHINQIEVGVVYNGVYILIAIVFNVLWRYASHERRLLDDAAHPAHVQSVTDGYRWGPLLYVAALLLALVSLPASLLLNIALAIYFALPRARHTRATTPTA